MDTQPPASPQDGQSPAPVDDELQFERAEASEPGTTVVACAGCRQPLAGYYYQANGQMICVPCREKLSAALVAGSPFLRFIKAGVLGVVAAAIGAGIYYGVAAVTGYELGLVAIVLGLMVGVAVRIGSGGRGGWFYQLLAIILTYVAIAGTYMPSAYSAFKESIVKERQAKAQRISATAPAKLLAPTGRPDEFTSRQEAFVVAVAFVGALFWPIDFSVMSYIIKGIALYEAWKINKRRQISVRGPFALGPQAASAATGVVPAS